MGRTPDYDHLRVFGCIAWAHIPKATRKPWDPRARKCIFLGYGQDELLATKGYILWDPRSKKKIVTPHATFWEDTFWKDSSSAGDLPLFMDDIEEMPMVIQLPDDEMADDVENEPAAPAEGERPQEQAQDPQQDQPEQQDQIGPQPQDVDHQVRPGEGRSGGRERRPPAAPRDYVLSLSSAEPEHHQPDLETILDNCFSLSMISDNVDEYTDAKIDEMKSMAKHKVWTLVPNDGQKTIGSRFVLSEKVDADSVVTKKARLIAQGFGQILGIDCHDIFSPVVKMESLRSILALATLEGLELLQGDVNTAYLYSPIDEVVYMRQPKGFEEPGKDTWLCKLDKSIYGLRQSARNWNAKLTEVLSAGGFEATLSEPSLYTRKNEGGQIIGMMAVYVDDLLIAGSSTVLSDIRNHMDRTLTMKWNSDPRLILGLQIDRDVQEGTLRLSQSRFIDEILEQFDMQKCTPMKMPMRATLPFPQEDRSKPDAKFPFLECIGKLNWLARGTRPDIAFAVSHLARFCSCYQSEH